MKRTNKKNSENLENLISLEEFLEHTDDVLYLVEFRNNTSFTEPVRFVSAKTETILGYSADDFVNDQDLWFRSLHHEDVTEVTESTQRCVDTKKAVTRNYRFCHGKTGIYIHLEDKIVPKVDKEGIIVALYGVARDVTRRRSLEKQLSQSQKIEALGRLAASIAHELSNVLSPVVGYPDLILSKLPEDEPISKAVKIIRDSAEKASAITQDLLMFAQRSIIKIEVINLNDLVLDYLRSPKHNAFETVYPGIRIETDFMDDLDNIDGSLIHISNALANLISNAAEAMPGKGRITLSTRNLNVSAPLLGFETVPEGDYAVVSVTDTGMGIMVDDIKEIFEPFFTKKPLGRRGTGLGLFIVRGVLDDHKGFINVISSKEDGAVFSLYFPATKQKRNKSKRNSTIASYAGTGTVLIVDDEETQRKMISMMLEALGYTFTALSSGEEAIDFLKDNAVDLIILDVVMKPGIDGIETYRNIIQEHPKQKVMFLSGFANKQTLDESREIGPCTFVNKPCTLEKLGIAVKEALGRKIKQ